MGSYVCLGELHGGEFGDGSWRVLEEMLFLVVSGCIWLGAVKRVFGALDWAWWYWLCCGCGCTVPVVLW